MNRYAIGIDFGTLSGRALLINAATGEELATAVLEYAHAVMDKTLPDGTVLPHDWALQHPQDYLEVVRTTVPAVLKEAGVSPAEVIGVGVDFTASTLLPVTTDGTPLCFLEQYKSEPHAYAKLWKHHSPQDQAARMTAAAKQRGETWLENYGGKVSSEWTLPKLLETLEQAPEVCEEAYAFVEAGDWLVWQMTGNRTYNACAAGYKAQWSKQEGFPSEDYLNALHPGLAELAYTKMFMPPLAMGGKAGELTETGAALTGLLPGTAVAAANIDAHAGVPAAGIDGPGKMLAIVGTSTCHMVLGCENKPVPGICGSPEDGLLPGYFGFEAGQTCVGDSFAWFNENCLPAAYEKAAKESGKSIHEYLREKASALQPGESGLLALDWFNGNRSILVDADLSGMILGLTLQTKPEEIYRALLESTAYGTRMIIENYRAHGVAVNEFYATGGIARKDPLMMQIYADVLRMPVHVVGSKQGPALGSAMYAAVAAGEERGGYSDIAAAVHALAPKQTVTYTPVEENAAVYDELFAEYARLHDYFGRGGADTMKILKNLRNKS